MPLDRWAKSFGIFLNIKYVLSKCAFFFPKLFSVEFLAHNVVFSFVFE